MLSSRAAAFSVKALLNPNSDRGKASDTLQPFTAPEKHGRRKHGRTKSKHGGDRRMLTEGYNGIMDTGTGMVQRVEEEDEGEENNGSSMLGLEEQPLKGQGLDDRIFKDYDNQKIFDEEEELVDVENCIDSPRPCTTPRLPLGMSHAGLTSPSVSPMDTIHQGVGGRPSSPYRGCDPSPLSSLYLTPQLSTPSSSANADWQMYTHSPNMSNDSGGGVGGEGGGGGGGRRMSTDREVSMGHGCGGLTIQLLQNDLWTKFNDLGTEMIITKNGRRMFPVVKVGLHGLHPDKNYMVYLDMVAVDNRRYRYVYPRLESLPSMLTSSRWMVAGTGEPLGDHPPYIHPDSPSTGAQWMAAPAVAFDRLKLTNNKTRQTKGQIILHSMQKYQPRVWVQEVDGAATWVDLPGLVDLTTAYSASFTETTFITVTAYQNQQITRLKIDSNPFAKGFRDTTKQKEQLERQLLPDVGPHDGQSIASMPYMLPLGMPGPHHAHPHHHLSMANFPTQYAFTCPTSLSQYSLTCPNPPPPSQYHHHHTDRPPQAQFSLNSPVSPPISPVLLPHQWYPEAMEAAGGGGGGRAGRRGGGEGGGALPWMQELSGAAFYRTRSMPLLLPPYLQSFQGHHLPHALDLSKRKEDT